MDNRKPLDAATEITVAWIQRHPTAPAKEKVNEFFVEAYKAVKSQWGK